MMGKSGLCPALLRPFGGPNCLFDRTCDVLDVRLWLVQFTLARVDSGDSVRSQKEQIGDDHPAWVLVLLKLHKAPVHLNPGRAVVTIPKQPSWTGLRAVAPDIAAMSAATWMHQTDQFHMNGPCGDPHHATQLTCIISQGSLMQTDQFLLVLFLYACLRYTLRGDVMTYDAGSNEG